MNQLLTSSLLCGGILLAADFWQTKKPSEWTEKEARRIVDNSPWAKEIQPSMNMESMGGGRGGGMGRGGGGGGMGAGGGQLSGPGGGPGGGGGMGGPPGGGGMGEGGAMGGGSMQMPRVKVTFETAIPVVEAKSRMEIKDVFQGVRGKYVVISVSGMRTMGGGGSAATRGQPQGDPAERQKAMQERLLQLTTLKIKDDKVYQPAEAKMQQTPSGPVMLFAFPRNELQFAPDDKQLTFKTSMGPIEIQVKFNLKDMMYEKQLTL